MKYTHCIDCGIESGRKRCPQCGYQRRSEYYRNWYAKNGRRRNGNGRNDTAAIMEWRAKYPEKVRAHKLVAGALKRGELVNPSECSNCHYRTTYLEAHHPDYSKPLAVIWLCPTCHRNTHAAMKRA